MVIGRRFSLGLASGMRIMAMLTVVIRRGSGILDG